MTNAYKEYGLKVPNGNTHWGAYLGRPFETEEQRASMLDVLRRTAVECGFNPEDFTSNYKWVLRTVTPHTKEWDVDDEEVAPVAAPEAPAPVVEAPAKKAAPRPRRKASTN